MRINLAAIAVLAITIFISGCSEKKPETTSNPETPNNTQNNNSAAGNEPKKNPNQPLGIKYDVDARGSTIEWKAKKVTGEHFGTIQMGRGEIFVDNDKLMAGNFAFDMSTIKVTDIKDSATNAKLVGHLKSDDFFSVEKNPIGRYYFSSVTPTSDDKGNNYILNGSMVLKGITKEVAVPVKLTKIPDGTYMGEADFEIDRTLFDIKFRSGKFFENLGDNLIEDKFNVKMKFTAKTRF